MKIFQGIHIILATIICGCAQVDPCTKTRGKSIDDSQIREFIKKNGPYTSWAYLGPCSSDAGVIRYRRLNNFGGFSEEFYLVENSVLSSYLDLKTLKNGQASEPSFFWPQHHNQNQ